MTPTRCQHGHVIEPPSRPTRVELLEVEGIRLVEAVAPRVTPKDQVAMDRVWYEAVQANPSLFDGPVAACMGLDREGQQEFVLTWVRTTFRSYVLRRVPGASWLPSSLFVGVAQPADSGGLLVGRMSSSTASPGRWQLPGGSVEPPADHKPLDMAALRLHATRELVEETGVEAAPDDLIPWLVTRGEHGNTGVLFLAPSQPMALLRERFAALLSSEISMGRDSELDQIALVRTQSDLARLDGPHVDYLAPVVGKYAGSAPRCDA